MSDHITSETISRRKLLSVLGLGLALAVPTTTLTVSEAEAQTTGMTRRQDGAQAAMSGVMIGARVARTGVTPDARVARSSNRGAFVASNWPRP